MNGFIIVSIDEESKNTYIMNTSPILWTSEITKVKIFDSYASAKNELEDNFISLVATVSYTSIKSIWILEYHNNVEIGRVKFI